MYKWLSLVSLTLIFAACDSGEIAEQVQEEVVDYAALLEDSSWELVDIVVLGGFVFEPEVSSDYTIRFRPENRFTGKSDCNTLTGNWQVAEDLTITGFNSTRSMCPPGSLHNYFSLYLRDVVSMELEGESLTLRTTTEGVTLQFQPGA